MSALASSRPPLGDRNFTSTAVEALLAEVSAEICDPELAWLFSNCFPSALDTAVRLEQGADGKPETFVETGNPNEAVGMRDATALLWPYLSLANDDPGLKSLLAGLVRRQATCLQSLSDSRILGSKLDTGAERQFTGTDSGIPERQDSALDQLCGFMRFSHGYWSATGDASAFDPGWESAVAALLGIVEKGQEADEEQGTGPQSSGTASGASSAGCPPRIPSNCRGLIRSQSRPSGEPGRHPFHVPANAMAVVCLGLLAEMLRQLKRSLPQALILAQKAEAIAASIREGLGNHAIVEHPVHGEILAYEIDGFGSHSLMDEAILPSLLSAPYLGCCAKNDPLYQQTRSFVLGSGNPCHAEGTYGRGVGTHQLGLGWISPESILMQALTSDTDEEIATCLGIIKAAHPRTGYLQEAFWKDDPAQMTRPFSARASSLYAELILVLHQQRPYILEASFARCGR